MVIPVVSIIIPSYNKSSFLAEAIESVARQTFQSFELIIVDDASDDCSVEVACSASSRIPGASVKEVVHGGVSAARNAGYSQSHPSSRYLWFLDADDILEPHALEVMVQYMDEHLDAGMAYCKRSVIDEHGVIRDSLHGDRRVVPTWFGFRSIPPWSAETPLASLWTGFSAIPSASMFRRAVFDQTRSWDSDLCRPAVTFHAEDKDMAIQMALLGPIHLVPIPLVRYRVVPGLHQQHMYSGLKILNARWWTSPYLSPDEASRVRRAIWFDAALVCYDRWIHVGRALRHGKGKSVPALAISAMVSSVRALCTPLRYHRARPGRATP